MKKIPSNRARSHADFDHTPLGMWANHRAAIASLSVKAVTQTALERHCSPYAGRRGRYIPRGPIETIDREDGE
jgi:hypothetical protein